MYNIGEDQLIYCCATAEARSINNNETIKKFKENNKKMTQEI